MFKTTVTVSVETEEWYGKFAIAAPVENGQEEVKQQLEAFFKEHGEDSYKELQNQAVQLDNLAYAWYKATYYDGVVEVR